MMGTQFGHYYFFHRLLLLYIYIFFVFYTIWLWPFSIIEMFAILKSISINLNIYLQLYVNTYIMDTPITLYLY